MKKYTIQISIIRDLIFTITLLCNIYGFSQNRYEMSYDYIDKNFISIESKLVVLDNKSVFKLLDDRESGKVLEENGSDSYTVLNDELSTFIYSETESIYKRIPYPVATKGTAYQHSNNTINWILSEESKKIGSYDCQKAKAQVGGRNYEVWFTKEIPIQHGPMGLHGLPGLIVEVKEQSKFCSLKLISVKNDVDSKIFREAQDFFKYKEVMSYDEYKTFMKKFVVQVKIDRANKISELVSKYNLTDLEIEIPSGEYNWVSYIIDIPEGTIEELEKISLYK